MSRHKIFWCQRINKVIFSLHTTGTAACLLLLVVFKCCECEMWNCSRLGKWIYYFWRQIILPHDLFIALVDGKRHQLAWLLFSHISLHSLLSSMVFSTQYSAASILCRFQEQRGFFGEEMMLRLSSDLWKTCWWCQKECERICFLYAESANKLILHSVVFSCLFCNHLHNY
jgi:hypothetical protein